MRLINTSTLSLESELPYQKGPYAILSHTWSKDINEEVSFEDMSVSPTPPHVRLKPGYRKIVETCDYARTRYGLEYAWVDTCCINKTSNSELSEAINSMFRYYQEATVCLAYLSDWDPACDTFERCLWFKRGWTLQELIAPRELLFFDRDWILRGTKQNRAIARRVEEITGIDTQVLNHHVRLEDIPVAVRMSWASGRETTRLEDRAYSLLGIFDINMPMLYGEGMKAFLRLQENIIRQSTDMSIFAWTHDADTQKYTGLLAQSPEDFKRMQGLTPQPDTLLQLREYSITNRGIRFNTPLVQDTATGFFILPVNHGYFEQHNRGVYLRQVGMDLFVRADPNILPPMPAIESTAPNPSLHNRKEKSFHVKTLSTQQSQSIQDRILRVEVEEPHSLEDLNICSVEPSGSWSLAESSLYAGHMDIFLAYLHFTPVWSDEFDSFVLVFYFEKNRWQCDLARGDDWQDLYPRFHDHYRYGRNLHAADRSLELPHLYEHGKSKIVHVSLVTSSSESSKARLRLRIQDKHVD